MIEAVLFDIDNTLILFDEKTFIREYIAKLVPRFADIHPPEYCRRKILEATNALMENRGVATNAQHYLTHFLKDTDADRGDIWHRFEDFYATEFDQFSRLVQITEGAARLLETIRDEGLHLVAASNPFWPLSVQKIRLGWAGLSHIPFRYITHIENSSYCKPQPNYYLEICRQIEIHPCRCLMVGNDPVNDIIAGKTGMKTYLTTDADTAGLSRLSVSEEIREKSGLALHDPDFTGPLSGVMDAIRELNG